MRTPSIIKEGSAKLILIAVCSLLLLLGLLSLMIGDEYSNLDSFPASDFAVSPAGFLGNEYVLRAQIDTQLQWQPGIGRLVVVKTEKTGIRLPVFIAERIEQNVHSGQRYEMYIQIQAGGLIHVEDLRKY
jgi:hypothetical protein